MKEKRKKRKKEAKNGGIKLKRKKEEGKRKTACSHFNGTTQILKPKLHIQTTTHECKPVLM
jgi:hypothetical protein